MSLRNRHGSIMSLSWSWRATGSGSLNGSWGLNWKRWKWRQNEILVGRTSYIRSLGGLVLAQEFLNVLVLRHNDLALVNIRPRTSIKLMVLGCPARTDCPGWNKGALSLLERQDLDVNLKVLQALVNRVAGTGLDGIVASVKSTKNVVGLYIGEH